MLFNAVWSFKGADGSFLAVGHIYNLKTRPVPLEEAMVLSRLRKQHSDSPEQTLCSRLFTIPSLCEGWPLPGAYTGGEIQHSRVRSCFTSP